jgi:hypothetical protein
MDLVHKIWATSVSFEKIVKAKNRAKIRPIWSPGLPDFSRHNNSKRGKIYQSPTKLPKDHHTYIPNGYGIYQPLQFQGPPKFAQIGNFGLKVSHLATLGRPASP